MTKKDKPNSSKPEIPNKAMRILPREVSAAQRLARSAGSKWTGGQPVVCWLYPWKDTNPIEIMMTPAQKKPSLNWEVFHPSLKPMIDTMIPEMSDNSMALITMRRIVFFMALSVGLYSGWLTWASAARERSEAGRLDAVLARLLMESDAY